VLNLECNNCVGETEICTKDNTCVSMSVVDEKNGIWWQNSVQELVYSEAQEYCLELSLLGHNDWRIPSNEEYISLLGNCDEDVENLGDGDLFTSEYVTSGYCSSCSDSAFCNKIFGDDQKTYWSSTEWSYNGDPYRVDFGDGEIYNTKYREENSVRCVRTP
jgi:hypothetical protein